MTTINVSSSAELQSALARAQSGDDIRLAGGEYGALAMNSIRQSNVTFDSTLTIASADPNRPAVFSKLDLGGASNVALEGLEFRFTASEWKPFRISNSSNIEIDNATFDGIPASGYGAGVGLLLTGSRGITIANSEFAGFSKGLEVLNTDALKFLGNDMHSFSGDGMTLAQVRGVQIEGNAIRDVMGDPGSSFHKDMIQFWTYNTTVATSDVVIRGNTLESGDGTTQALFMGNEIVRGGGSREFLYRNVLIEDNTIRSGHYNAVRIGESDGLTIRDNVVLQGAGAASSTPHITVAAGSVNVTVAGNVANGLNLPGGAGWSVAGNQIVPVGYEAPLGSGPSAPPAAETPPETPPETPAAPEETPAAPAETPAAPEEGGQAPAEGEAAAPSAPAETPAETPEAEGGATVEEGEAPPASAPVAEPAAAPAPEASPEAGGAVPLAALAVPQSRTYYADLADTLGLSLKDGSGDAGDNLVLAQDGTASAGGGDNIVIGDAGANQIVDGPGSNVLSGLGAADAFVFTGSGAGAPRPDIVLDADFAEGDSIVLHGYAPGTFAAAQGGDAPGSSSGGSMAVIDSVAGLRALAAIAEAVTLEADGDALELRIAEAGGVQSIYLAGLGELI